MADTTAHPPETKAPEAPAAGAHAEAGPSKASAAKAAAVAKVKGLFGKLKNPLSGSGSFLKAILTALVNLPMIILRGGLGTKIIAIGFLASLALGVTTGAKLYRHYLAELRLKAKARLAEPDHTEALNEFARQQKELKIVAANLLFLDRFSAAIQSKTGNAQTIELEIYLEADAPETAQTLKGHIEEVREIISNSIQNQVYDKLMTDEGKEEFKSHISEAIKTKGLIKWESQGAVKRVFFTKLMMGG